MIDFIIPNITRGTARWIIRSAARILSIAVYLLTLISAYGGYFNPTWWTFPAIGILFFPYLAMATLAIAALWLFNRRIIMGCTGIGILLACGPTFSQALPFKFGANASVESNSFRMVTFNCLHMEDSQAGRGAALPASNRSLHFLINSGADFICLQELYSFRSEEIPSKYKPQIDSLLQLYPYYSKDSGREIEFLSKHPFIQQEVKLGDDVRYGSCAAYRLKIDGKELTVVNVHLPSYLLSEEERKIITEARSEQGMKRSLKEFEGTIYSKMKNAFAERARVSKAIAEYTETVEGNVIVCGDFNDVPGSWTYRNFIKRGFEDAYAQTGFGHIITYNEHLMWFHIDQILYRGELVPLYVRKERMDASDHYPLVAEFEFL